MKKLFTGGRRKVAAVMAIALVASLSQVTTSGASGASTPKRGGNITVGVFDSFPGFCMADNLANSALMGGRTIYETWVEQRADGKIVPYILKSFESSADYKTWNLVVRDGIKFHDGSPVDGTALLLNLQASRGALYLNGLIGKTPKSPSSGTGAGFSANIADVIQTGAMSVTIKLYNAEANYPDSLYASGRNFVRSIAQITGPNCSTVPIGTGAFKYVSHKLTELVVAKNENYWRKDAAGVQLPYLDSITFKYVSSATARANAVRSGSADLAMFASSSDAKQMASLLNDKKVKSQLTGNNYYPVLGPNLAIAPFNDKNARLALAYGTDQASYFKARNCTNGRCFGEVRDSIVGKQNILYNKAGYIKYDLAKAKAAVKAYETATGKKLEFTINVAVGDSGGMDNAKFLVAMWKKAGMTVSINNSYTSAVLVAKVYPSAGDVAQGK